MRKQALVIGLGQFGMALVKALTELKVDVLAADRDPELVQTATRFAVEAVAFNAVDEIALGRAAPAQRDLAICAIGTDRESSIICTALLRQLGAPHVVARATDPVHERILRLVGAHEVVNPDQDYGRRFAKKLLFRGLLDAVPLGDDLSILELKTPRPFVGKTLKELALPKNHNITVAAIRPPSEEPGGALEPPRADRRLTERDVLVIVAPESAVNDLVARNNQ